MNWHDRYKAMKSELRLTNSDFTEIAGNTIDIKKTGNGHFSISIEIDGQELETTTTNTMAIDAAFDDCYDDEDNYGRFYESREEAQEALVNEILRDNEIEL